MEGLATLITTLSNAPVYISIFFILIIILLILIVIPLVINLIRSMKKITRIKIGDKEVQLTGGEKMVSSIQKIDEKSYKLIFSTVEEIYEKYFNNETAIKQTTYQDLKQSREDCINRAIETIRVDFTNDNISLKDFEITENFFSLFLEIEFGKVLRDELSVIIKMEKLNELSEIDISDKLKEIIDSCTNKIALNIKKYAMIIDRKLVLETFKNSHQKIRDYVDKSIKYFVTLSKKEKEDLIKLNEKKLNELENKLKMILEIQQKE